MTWHKIGVIAFLTIAAVVVVILAAFFCEEVVDE